MSARLRNEQSESLFSLFHSRSNFSCCYCQRLGWSKSLSMMKKDTHTPMHQSEMRTSRKGKKKAENIQKLSRGKRSWVEKEKFEHHFKASLYRATTTPSSDISLMLHHFQSKSDDICRSMRSIFWLTTISNTSIFLFFSFWTNDEDVYFKVIIVRLGPLKSSSIDNEKMSSE